MDKIVFIACGQLTKKELRLGKKLENLVNSKSGLKAFLAETVNDPQGLTTLIFENLSKCVGFIGILHNRKSNKRNTSRFGSLWINQEIGILAYKRSQKKEPIPYKVFIEKGLEIEGVLRYIGGRPEKFITDDVVVENVNNWLMNLNVQTADENISVQEKTKITVYRIIQQNHKLASIYNAGPEDIEDFKVKLSYTRSGVGDIEDEERHEFLNETANVLMDSPLDRNVLKRGETILLVNFPSQNIVGKVKVNIVGKTIFSGKIINQYFEI
jgi:hypothetical protein